ncbi:MAG: hypothetical protein K0B14_08115 [Anaerolineaceae bacterium]|nr:hypothetical protein [Anaerolineaceae bacterium]
MRDEIDGQFNPIRNPFLDHCRYQLFLLVENGEVIGRIAAFIDDLAVDFWQERRSVLPSPFRISMCC